MSDMNLATQIYETLAQYAEFAGECVGNLKANLEGSIEKDTVEYMRLRDHLNLLRKKLAGYIPHLNREIQQNEKIRKVPKRELEKLERDKAELAELARMGLEDS